MSIVISQIVSRTVVKFVLRHFSMEICTTTIAQMPAVQIGGSEWKSGLEGWSKEGVSWQEALIQRNTTPSKVEHWRCTDTNRDA